MLEGATRAFPLWVVAASVVALIEPRWLTWFSGPLLTWGLGVVMLGMGLTLQVEDFARVAQAPGTVATGVVLQYTVMPLLGWALGPRPGFAASRPTPAGIAPRGASRAAATPDPSALQVARARVSRCGGARREAGRGAR